MATQKEIAAHLIMSERYIGGVLRKLGLPTRNCDLDEAREKYIAQLRETAAGRTVDSGDYELIEERARLAFHQANAQEMKNKVLAREYAPVSVISAVITNLAQQIVSITDSIPIKIKKRLPHLKASDIEIVKREIVKTRNAASKVRISWDDIPDPD